MAARLSHTVRKLFEDPNFCHVAVLLKDGSPHVSPVWVDIEGDTILVNTAEGRVKQVAATRDPRVALSIVDQGNPYHSASVRGRVAEITTEGADRHIDTLAQKYLGRERYPGRQPGEVRVILKIVPERVSEMGP